MRPTPPAALLLVLAAACTSAGAPGGQDVTRQVDRAKVVQIESALTTAARAQEEHRATQGTYTADARALGANPPVGVTLTVAQADATRYCIEATHSGLEGTWHVTSSSPAAEGSC